MIDTYDIERNRAARKYPLRVQSARLLWGIGRILFRCIPRPLYSLRVQLLRLFGAQIGRNVHISNSAVIYFPWELVVGDYSSIGDNTFLYNLAELRIGRRVTISQRAHICGGTHDYRDAALPLIKCPINIGDDAWVCADAFIGPNIVVGAGAVVAARSVVVKPVAEWTVVAGNPARFIKSRLPRNHGGALPAERHG